MAQEHSHPAGKAGLDREAGHEAHDHDHDRAGGGDHGGHDRRHEGHSHADHGHEGRDHGGHSHAVTGDSERKVLWAMLLTGGFMLAELAGGIVSGSLALIADAGHMLTDFASLVLAWFAFRLAKRPADPKRSYGYHRFQVLAAFVNGISLFAIALWITVEAVGRFFDPVEILGGQMLVIAVLGLVVNIVAFWILHRGGSENLNVRGAALHVLGDMLGSVGAIAAALVIVWTGWTPIDPILSVAVVLLILRGAWKVTVESGHILLEGAPKGIDAARIGAAVTAVPGVLDVHHVHAWSLTSERPMLTLHAVIADGADDKATLIAINTVLRDRLGIDHATVQLERGSCVQSAAGHAH